jgi:uncharacterized protein YfaS (alpha-2-macroglobulin family)
MALILAIALGASACSRTDRQLQQQREKLDSLSASTTAIADAWLAGSTSGTFTTTALEQTFVLLETQRQALAVPNTLVDQRAARLSQAAEAHARLLAAMMHDVRAADARAVREHLSKLRTIGPGSR